MAAAAEIGGQEHVEDALVFLHVDEATRQRHDVGVVVLAAQLGELGVDGVHRADAVDLVSGDGHADSRAAHENAVRRHAACHLVGDLGGEVGVIDAVVGVGAQVVHLIALLFKIGSQKLLLLETRVIACNADNHVPTLPYVVNLSYFVFVCPTARRHPSKSSAWRV